MPIELKEDKTLLLYEGSSTLEKEAEGVLDSHPVNVSGLLHFLHVKCSPNNPHDSYFKCHEFGITYCTLNMTFSTWGKRSKHLKDKRGSDYRQGHLNSAELLKSFLCFRFIVTQLFLFRKCHY